MTKLIYALLLLTLVVSCKKNKSKASYDIRHYDWSPDSTVLDSVFLDLNNDHIDDLKFVLSKTLQGSTPSGGPYYNYSSNVVALNNDLLLSLGTKLPQSNANDPWDCLKLNDAIGPHLTWDSSFRLNYHVIIAGHVGTWDTNTNEGFIGLKFKIGQSSNWGWIKVSTTITKITLKEYAINELLNQPIAAGQIQ